MSAVPATNCGKAHDTIKCRDIRDSLAHLSCCDISLGVSTNASIAAKKPAPTEIERSAQPKKPVSTIGEPLILVSKRDNGPISFRLMKVVKRLKASTEICPDNEQIGSSPRNVCYPRRRELWFASKAVRSPAI